MTNKPNWLTSADEIKSASQWLRGPLSLHPAHTTDWDSAFRAVSNGNGVGTVKRGQDATAMLTHRGWMIVGDDGRVSEINSRKQWDKIMAWETI